MNFGILVGVIILGLLCLCMVVFIAWWSYAFFRANANPTISTFGHLKDMMKDLDLGEGKQFIDLGCGNGSTLRWFSEQYPTHTYTGVDINRLALRWGRRRNKQLGKSNITLKYQDIYTVNLDNYDIIYCFLMTSEMQRIQDHFDKYLTSKQIVICAAFKLPDREPIHTVSDKGTNKIFVYKKNT